MAAFRDLSIRRKFTLAVVGTTASALIAAFVVLAAHEAVTRRRAMVEETRTLARIVAVHTRAAVAFDDPAAASETLHALEADGEVMAAALYGPDGRLFAAWARDGQPPVPERAGEGFAFEAGNLLLHQPDDAPDEPGGSVHLRISTRTLVARLWLHVAVLAGVLVAAAGLAASVAAGMRRAIQGPIDELVTRSEALARGRLAVGPAVDRGDEIGIVARSFDDMAASLRALISQVRDAIRAVGTAAATLGETSDRVVRETRRQNETVERAADQVGSVTRSIQEVNQGVDELARVGEETSTSIAAIRASVDSVASRMEQLAPAIDSTSAAIVQLSSGVQSVAGQVQTLDTASSGAESALVELTASVHRVRDEARASQELSVGTHTEAERGMQSVNETIGSIHEIEASFKRLDEIVGRLAEGSESIGEIVRVIDDVADETQLLSLNAAIIAAQAGERGSAFAVVAEEVKRLAERTARSTREITGLTGRIREETRRAVAAMADGAETVERGVARSEEAGARLGGIMRSAALARERADEIAGATESQSADIVLVDEAMAQVRGFVREIRSASGEQERAVAEIAQLLEEVRALGNEVRSAAAAQGQESGRIGETMQRLTERIRWILGTTEGQRRSSDQIDRALGVFREVAESGTRRVRELEAVTATLAARSAALEREIGRFEL